tara:strand:- start:22911 stop:24215 length:1305 start_codon:yes stop_codon:yes gene_type:complete
MYRHLSLLTISFVLVLCSSLSKKVHAQEFTDGYIIDLKGDTLKGRIFQPENQENYLQINFFLAGNPDYAFQHTPASIREYGFSDGGVYRSFTIKQSINPSNTNPLFLKVLIDKGGELALFVYRDSANEEFYFFETKDSEIIYINRNNYRTFLNDYAQDCNKAFSKTNFSRQKYSTKDLSDYVNRYNSCYDEFYDADYSYFTDNILKFGVNIGTGSGFIVHPNYTLDSPDFNIGLSIEKTQSPKYSMLLELGFTKKSLTYKSTQEGRLLYVVDGASRQSITEISTTSEIDLIALYANLEIKKTFENSLHLIYGVGISRSSNKSEGEYTVITTDQDIIDSQNYSFRVKRKFIPSGSFLSYNLGVGIPINIKDLYPSIELRASYNLIKSSAESNDKNEYGNKPSIIISEQYLRYILLPPALPKISLDLTLKIPVYSR